MDAGETRPCPHCGSTETQTFEDRSGQCRTCGRSFLGETPIGAMIHGEEVEAGPAKAVVREKNRLGWFGVAGGVLGYLAVPSTFAVGAALGGSGFEAYTADVFNRPEGALICGGLVLIVIFAWYASWAGFHVWRGYPERARHLVIAGLLLMGSSALGGWGLPGIVGIVGGVLALVAGLLVWRAASRKAEESGAPPPAAA